MTDIEEDDRDLYQEVTEGDKSVWISKQAVGRPIDFVETTDDGETGTIIPRVAWKFDWDRCLGEGETFENELSRIIASASGNKAVQDMKDGWDTWSIVILVTAIFGAVEAIFWFVLPWGKHSKDKWFFGYLLLAIWFIVVQTQFN